MDEDVINSQESVITDDGQVRSTDGIKTVSTEKLPIEMGDAFNNEKRQVKEK